MMGDSDGLEPGIHAEHNALLKLKPIKIKRKLESINLLVVRFSKTSKIQSSKPASILIKLSLGINCEVFKLLLLLLLPII